MVYTLCPSTRAMLGIRMLTRVPTPSVSRTYVRSKTNDKGEIRYEASVVVTRTGQRLSSTNISFKAAVKAARWKAGIRK